MSTVQSKQIYKSVPSTATNKNLKVFSKNEVSTHSKEGDLWIIIDSAVYE